MTYLLRHRNGGVVMGDTLLEVVQAAGMRIANRTLFIGDHKYCSYGPSFTDEELPRAAARDALRLLRDNHGWRTFREMDWRD